ncbi:glycoside hydrolase [Crocinitomicaceae bacterium]|nr:glycoside hydrolase [Crocinitomicaceae bacterium]
MKKISSVTTGCVKLISILIVCLPFLVLGQSDYKNVQIPLAKGFYTYSGCEPSIDIDPNNPNNIAVGSILDGYHYSEDSGKTWKAERLESPYGVYGDPVLKFNGKGNIFYLHLSSYNKTSHLDRIVCQRANDLKGKFNEGSYSKPNGSKVQDKHWIVIDPETDEIYMTWTQFDAYNSTNSKDSSFIHFAKSSDDGETWTDPVRISIKGGDCLDGDDTVEGAMPALGKEGMLYTVWSGPHGLILRSSADRGQTWSPTEQILFKHEGGWTIDVPDFYRSNGLPVFISDHNPDSRFYGNLYLNWAIEDEETGRTSVLFSKSEDNGESWSSPVQVHKDSSEYNHFLTWMTVDPSNGNLHFVYYRKSRKSKATDVVWASSKNGGESFVEEVISEQSFEPSGTVFFGDYLNIAAVDNVVRPVWPRMDNGKITLWTALINFE